jgi:hypothetical protein
MNRKNNEPDAQDLLPIDFREDWAAIPRLALYQIFLVGFLIGAGLSITIYAYFANNIPAMVAYPVALLIAKLQNWLIPWDRRARNQLQKWHNSNA